jgi:hypothetical protein
MGVSKGEDKLTSKAFEYEDDDVTFDDVVDTVVRTGNDVGIDEVFDNTAFT